jgi:hypothetical protein
VLVLVLFVGSVARLTRLVTADSITDPIRAKTEKVVKKATSRKVWTWVDDLINCPWCVSMWIGVIGALVVLPHWQHWFVFCSMAGLTASWLAANVQVREPE